METAWLSIGFTIVFTIASNFVLFYIQSTKNSVIFTQNIEQLKAKQQEQSNSIKALTDDREKMNLKLATLDNEVTHLISNVEIYHETYRNDSKDLRNVLNQVSLSMNNLNDTMQSIKNELRDLKRS